MHFRRKSIFRSVTRKENISMYILLGLQAADDLTWSRIDYTVSGFRKVLFFHSADRRNLARTR